MERLSDERLRQVLALNANEPLLVSMASELLMARERIAKLEAALKQIRSMPQNAVVRDSSMPNTIWKIADAALAQKPDEGK